jgi:hypothetical protein
MSKHPPERWEHGNLQLRRREPCRTGVVLKPSEPGGVLEGPGCGGG